MPHHQHTHSTYLGADTSVGAWPEQAAPGSREARRVTKPAASHRTAVHSHRAAQGDLPCAASFDLHTKTFRKLNQHKGLSAEAVFSWIKI